DFIEIPVTVSDESRFLIIGKISEKYWSGVITARCDISRRS
ncbi:MAG TPA: toxin, partial [Nitrospiraceae bacterium]|nr:toxin [Nitrospiraceae bacterium]